MSVVTTLPKVVAVTEIYDAGPATAGDSPRAACPHCGALGRYIIGFVTENGEQRGAMKGCWKLFPKGQFVQLTYELLEKELEEIRTLDDIKPKKMNGWDRAMLAALKALGKGQMSLDEVYGVIQTQTREKKEWMRKRGFSR